MPSQPYYNPHYPEPSPIRDRRRAFLAAIPPLYPAVISELGELLPIVQQSSLVLSTQLTAAEILEGRGCTSLRRSLDAWATRWRLTEDWALTESLNTLATWAHVGAAGDGFVHWEARYTMQPQLIRQLRSVRGNQKQGGGMKRLIAAVEEQRGRRQEGDRRVAEAKHELEVWEQFYPTLERNDAAAARTRSLHEEYMRVVVESAGLIQSPKDIDPIHLEWLIHFHVGNMSWPKIADLYDRKHVRASGAADAIGTAVRAATVRIDEPNVHWIVLRKSRGPGRPRTA